MEITDSEKKDFLNSVELNETNKRITVLFSNGEPDIRKVKAPVLNSEADRYKKTLEELKDEIEATANSYIEKLREIEVDYIKPSYFDMPVKLSSHPGSLTVLRKQDVDWKIKEIKRVIDEIKAYIENNFSEDFFSLSYNNYIHQSPFALREIQIYEISECENLTISPIIAKSLNLNKQNLEEANKRLQMEIKSINSQLKAHFVTIQDKVKQLNETVENIEKLFYNEVEVVENKLKLFRKLLKESVFHTGYYIDNENSLLFYAQQNGVDYTKYNSYLSNLNSQNPILEAFDRFLQNQQLYVEDESILKFNEIINERREKLLKAINDKFLKESIPNFDKEEINGFCATDVDGTLKLFVIEKDGTKVDFNETSLGRRWYLTYRFVKQLLKKDDLLFIDEPAAFLHPQAQAEFKKELQDLANKGIYVFITTHSPYMISEKWQNVYNVSMTENGTTIKRFGEDDDICQTIKEELGVLKTNDLLFHLSKTLLLVEGPTDKVCVEKFARKLNRNLSDYEIMPCNGSPILDVTFLCINKDIKFKALLDYDNKEKPEKWLNHKYGYKEYLEIINNNGNCVFTPEGEYKSLEDCFAKKDAEKYFSPQKPTIRPITPGCKECATYQQNATQYKTKMKIDQEKIKEGEVFEKETLDNFEQLFTALGIPKIDNEKSK